MEKVNFFNGMEVENTDLNDLELYFEERVNKNQAALSDSGVLVNADLPDGTILEAPYLLTDNTTISVYGFVAYDQEGHLLYLAPKYNEGLKIPTLQNLKPAVGTTPTIANRELISTGYTVDFGRNINYLIVARYNEVYTNALREQDATDVLLHTRIAPTVSFYLREPGSLLPNDVVLGTVTSDDFGNVYVDESNRDIFSVRGDLIVSDISQGGENLGTTTFEQHVNMLGSGSYSSSNPHALSPSDLGIDPTATGKHQQYEHTNGIVTDNKASTSSALAYQYSSATTTSNINDVVFYVQALSADNNEMAGIANTSLYPSDFSGALTYTLYQSTTYSGYYILCLTANATLSLVGPFTSTGSDFQAALQDTSVLPICSFYWGEPSPYTITIGGTLIGGSTISNWTVLSTDTFPLYNSSETKKASEVVVGDQIYYEPANNYLTVTSVIPELSPDLLTIKRIDDATLKDRRIFNTLSFKNITTTDLASMKIGAPYVADNNFCYHARVTSTSTSPIFLVSNLTLSVEFDGFLCSPVLVFPEASFYTAQGVIDQINAWVATAYTGPYTTKKPKALLNSDGSISFVAAESIVIQDSGINGAENILGFGSSNRVNADGLLKTIISTGDLASIQNFYYNASGQLIYIRYTLPSGIEKRQNISYTSEGEVTSFEEIV